MKKVLLLACTFFFLFLGTAKAIDIYGCSNLNTAGETYYLRQDILNSSSLQCMQITANNVTLDCMGHIIDGTSAANSFGVYVSNRVNITVKNCVVTDWANGIAFSYTNNSTITNITTTSNTAGIFLEYSDYNNLINITSYNNLYGVHMRYGNDYNYLFGIVSRSNSQSGISFMSSNNNILRNSIIENNYIYIDSSGSNLIYNNLFNSSTYVSIAGTILTNYWNTTRQAGTRIYSLGNEIGGNYWTNSTGNGYSDTCNDANKDGFCDVPYYVYSSNVDYLPLTGLNISENWGFENDIVLNNFAHCYATSNWCLYNESLAYRTTEDKTEGMYSLKTQGCSKYYICELVKPIGYKLTPGINYTLSFDIKKMGNINGSIYFGITSKDCYGRSDCNWKTSTYPFCVSHYGLFSITDSDIPNTNQWYHIEKTINTGTCYNQSIEPCTYPSPYVINADEILLIDLLIDPVTVYLDNFNITPTGALPHVSITKICKESLNQPYGWLACSPENIEIPSNAVNVTSYTAAYMIPYNYIYEGNASCNFTLQACNYALGYAERCGYKQNICSGVGYITGFSYYGTIFGGQTVKSYGSVTVPEGCIIPAEGGAGFNLTVITHVEYDLITLPPTKSASLSVYPERGNYSTIFYYHLITSNLAKPYNISFYVDGEWRDEIRNIYEDSYTIERGADKIGSYQVYLIVRDSEGSEIRTNNVTVYVGAGGLEPFTLTVIPTQGDAFTSFNFQTSQIRGGVAPYTVEIYHGADIFVGKCEGVPEGGICSLSKLLPCGYRNAFAIAKDSAGNQMVSNYVPVNVSCAPMGEPLNVTLTMTPVTGNSQTIFNLTFTIRGGAPPYRVTWLEWGNPLCSDEIYMRSPPFSVTERWKFPAGSRGISLSVRSADGQVAPSNLLTFEVTWAGETNYTSYDCIGTLGAWVQRGYEVPPAPYVPSYEPVINRTLFTQAGADWMAFFFTPIFFATIMLIGIAGFITLAIAKYGGGQFAPATFIIISMIMVAIYGMSGIYPTWLVIVLIVLAAFVFAKFVMGVI